MKVAIFDFDGTLYDSVGYWTDIITDYVRKRGGTPPPDIVATVKPLGMTTAAGVFKEEYGFTEEIPDIVKAWRSAMGEKYRHIIPVRKGAREYIEKLREQGVKICMATAMEKDFVMPALERTDMLPLFDSVVTIADVKANKNSPRIFQYCAEKYGVDYGDCVVFEDAPAAIRICREAGFGTVGVYDGMTEGEIPQLTELSDRCVLSFEELLEA